MSRLSLFDEAEESQQELAGYFDAGEVLVAIKGDRTVGHLQLIEQSAEATEINNLAVDPGFRRRRIGRMLIDAAVERARSHGPEEGPPRSATPSCTRAG